MARRRRRSRSRTIGGGLVLDQPRHDAEPRSRTRNRALRARGLEWTSSSLGRSGFRVSVLPARVGEPAGRRSRRGGPRGEWNAITPNRPPGARRSAPGRAASRLPAAIVDRNPDGLERPRSWMDPVRSPVRRDRGGDQVGELPGRADGRPGPHLHQTPGRSAGPPAPSPYSWMIRASSGSGVRPTELGGASSAAARRGACRAALTLEREAAPALIELERRDAEIQRGRRAPGPRRTRAPRRPSNGSRRGAGRIAPRTGPRRRAAWASVSRSRSRPRRRLSVAWDRSAAAWPPSPTVPSTIQVPGGTGVSQRTTSSHEAPGRGRARAPTSIGRIRHRAHPCSDSFRVMSSKPTRSVWRCSAQRSRLQISESSSAPAITTSRFSPAKSRSSGGTSVRPARSTGHSFALAHQDADDVPALGRELRWRRSRSSSSSQASSGKRPDAVVGLAEDEGRHGARRQLVAIPRRNAQAALRVDRVLVSAPKHLPLPPRFSRHDCCASLSHPPAPHKCPTIRSFMDFHPTSSHLRRDHKRVPKRLSRSKNAVRKREKRDFGGNDLWGSSGPRCTAGRAGEPPARSRPHPRTETGAQGPGRRVPATAASSRTYPPEGPLRLKRLPRTTPRRDARGRPRCGAAAVTPRSRASGRAPRSRPAWRGRGPRATDARAPAALARARS